MTIDNINIETYKTFPKPMEVLQICLLEYLRSQYFLDEISNQYQ